MQGGTAMTDDAQSNPKEKRNRHPPLRADPPAPPTLAPATKPPAWRRISTPPIPVLDHGHIRVIDYMGDDAAITSQGAARVSYPRRHPNRSRTTRASSA